MKRNIIKGLGVVGILLLLFILGFRPARYTYQSDDLIGFTYPSDSIGFGDYIDHSGLKKVIGVPGDLLTYKDGLFRNGQLVSSTIKIPSKQLTEYCITDGKNVEYVNEVSFNIFKPVNDSATAIILSVMLVVFVICFIFS